MLKNLSSNKRPLKRQVQDPSELPGGRVGGEAQNGLPGVEAQNGNKRRRISQSPGESKSSYEPMVIQNAESSSRKPPSTAKSLDDEDLVHSKKSNVPAGGPAAPLLKGSNGTAPAARGRKEVPRGEAGAPASSSKHPGEAGAASSARPPPNPKSGFSKVPTPSRKSTSSGPSAKSGKSAAGRRGAAAQPPQDSERNPAATSSASSSSSSRPPPIPVLPQNSKNYSKGKSSSAALLPGGDGATGGTVPGARGLRPPKTSSPEDAAEPSSPSRRRAISNNSFPDGSQDDVVESQDERRSSAISNETFSSGQRFVGETAVSDLLQRENTRIGAAVVQNRQIEQQQSESPSGDALRALAGDAAGEKNEDAGTENHSDSVYIKSAPSVWPTSAPSCVGRGRGRAAFF